MTALQILRKSESLYGLGRQATNFKGLYGLLQGSHLDNFTLKTFKLDWVAFHSVTVQSSHVFAIDPLHKWRLYLNNNTNTSCTDTSLASHL